eukprot:COSAG06_NODE_4105_length_4571_cov_3.031977_1_plen_423_part_00
MLLAATVTPGAAPTLRDHPIESGLVPLYLDGAWLASSSVEPGRDLNASVPGDILTDLQRAGRVPDPYYNSTWSDPSFVAAWNDGLWTYRKSFASPASVGGSPALLVFDGIRMGAMISLNGHQLGNASDQFLRYTFPVGPLLKPAGQINELRVVFGAELGIDCQGRWTHSSQIDWSPHMPPSTSQRGGVAAGRSIFGFAIWKSVYLLPVPECGAAVTELIVHTYYAGGHPVSALDRNHSGFDVNVTAELSWPTPVTKTIDVVGGDRGGGTLTVIGSWPGASAVTVKVNQGATSATATLPASQTVSARLWQPHGHGEQVRYSVSATFTPDCATASAAVATRLIGFRHIALVTVDDTDPKVVAAAQAQTGTGTLTMFYRVNGAPVYARGANKVPMDLLEGRMTAVAHRRLVQSAVEGNFNMLRLW